MTLLTFQMDAATDRAWWLEVGTLNPLCIYYFGPFETQQEANTSKHGYLQDLEEENSDIIFACSKFCQPQRLTIDKEELTIQELKAYPAQFFMAVSKALLWKILDRQRLHIEFQSSSTVNQLTRITGGQPFFKKLSGLHLSQNPTKLSYENRLKRYS